jgi:hypothetical protein
MKLETKESQAGRKKPSQTLKLQSEERKKRKR